MTEELTGPVASYVIKSTSGEKYDFEGTGEDLIFHLLFIDTTLLALMISGQIKIFHLSNAGEEIEKPHLVRYAMMIYTSRLSGFWDELSLDTRLEFGIRVESNKSAVPYDKHRQKRRSWIDKDPILLVRKSGTQTLMREKPNMAKKYFPDVPTNILYLIASLAVAYHLKKQDEKERELVT